METRLKPIEKPASWLWKLVYWLCWRQLGKVISPIKIIYARLPLRFLAFYLKIHKIVQKMSLSPEMALLIENYVAQINVCYFCIDIGNSLVVKHQLNLDKFYELQNYQNSPLFNAAERAALAFAEELTKNKQISDATYAEAQKHFTEAQLCEIAWLVATEHYYNLLNLAFNIHSDNLCQVRPKKRQIA
jgi:alkylhydroperoxidase family enzyme